MSLLLKPIAAIFSLFAGLAFLDGNFATHRPGDDPKIIKQVSDPKKPAPKIQAAILLDVSNSMDGLIEQAKAQLWNMVSVMGKAKCDAGTPQIEIALYEYGRDNNDEKQGFIKQISGFTSDLDQLSQELFKLTTYGGSEFCGQVIHTSLDQLQWDTASSSYKVIFISGNEDFLQGKVSYTLACTEARKKGVIVNTIYCGSRADGIREHWNLGAECGSGSFTFINSDARIDDIETPYDSTLMVLNDKLNLTYIGYGGAGQANVARQAATDKANYKLNKQAASKRAEVKGNKQLYNNESWDLVDAAAKDEGIVGKVDRRLLADTLQNKSKEELAKIVALKTKERGAIQSQIADISKQRAAYIVSEKSKASTNKNEPTLEAEVEKIIKQQAMRYNMKIE